MSTTHDSTPDSPDKGTGTRADSGRMRAMVVRAPGAAPALETVARPTPGPGEVTVDVTACGAGLTLEMARDGSLGGTFPRILGHELSGRVRRAGPGVTRWRPGDRVTTSFYLTCGHCFSCAHGRETLCQDFRGFVGSAIDGGFAETVRLPARNLVAVPDGVRLADAGIVADAVATPLHVVNSRLRTPPGAWVAVVGAGGGLGVHMLGVLNAVGARTVAVDSRPAKCAEIERRGLADAVLDADAWAAAAGRFGPGGITGVVDCVGSAATLDASLNALAPGGTLVVLGAAPGAEARLPGLGLILRELTVTGTRYANRTEIAQALDLVGARKVTPVIGARYPLERLPAAFEEIRRGEVFGRILIDVAPEDPA
ncbi:alcohol dehydrogenase catalytic domain-containing protein [Streptomyces sp. DSM 44917]|uniref:alcohol dehydrogenase n=1 Tax=Streptomyces boetiae TaxID=3075541 RepID=A0ABU2L746_9ACTN|nr:alcohol dehydrogenase catalytic domain-containing protein [Streptomyces sp. DSM 44917]MDT0307335.1 alcohol dehydrogenase catalytic domain-containing protein [Streptomyces sp. DSM 44917]